MSGNGASNTLVGQPALDHQWYPIALSEDIDPGPHGVQVLGRRYALWRSDDGSLTAAPDRCPHRQAPLSEGRMVDGCLECPYHGWRFGAGGRCELVPSSVPGTPVPPKAHLDTINIEERYGLVWLCPGKPLGRIPEIPQEDNPEFRRLNTPFQHWAVSSTRITDNFMDFSHFPFVHTATFGLAQETVIPPLEMGDLPDGYRGYVYEVNANNTSDAGQTVTGQEDDVLHRRMTTGYVLPFSVRSTIAYESGLEHILLLLTTPIGRRELAFQLRGVAKRRLLGAGRGDHEVRPRHRRGRQGHAGKTRRRAPHGPHRHRQRPVRPPLSGMAPPAWPH